MRRIGLTAVAATGIVALAVVGGGTRAGAGPAAAVVLMHPGTIHPGMAPSGSPPTTAGCQTAFKVACYQAPQIEQAYGLPALYRQGIDGTGQTIVIVDSFGSPTIRHDLGVFDQTFGLPAPPSLKVIAPAGKIPPYNPKSGMPGWAGETTLDVEYAHAIAPGANILLVETPVSENEGVSGFPQVEKAEEYVIRHHLGGVISQSFSATEQSFPTAQSLLRLRTAYQDAARQHITVLAASGDSGAADVGPDGTTFYTIPVTSWPDSDPLVTGVGGTQLHLNAAGDRTRPDTVWNDTYNVATQRYIFGSKGPDALAGGGGKSVIFARPGYQSGVQQAVGRQRGVPDVSMSGSCNGAVDVYQSFKGERPGWIPTCGTSEATPLFAGIVALADQVAGHPIGLINPALYQMSASHAPGLADVVTGSNTVSFPQGGRLHTVHGFAAAPGYDLASGVGTVDGPGFITELARLAG